MNYTDLAFRAHQNAVSHGFWDGAQPYEHYLMLVLTEIAEAVEGDRKGKKADRLNFEYHLFSPITKHETATEKERYAYWFDQFIKNTVEDEFADVAIRLLDLAGARKIRVETKGFQWKFDKTSFTENAYRLCQILASHTTGIDAKIILGIKYIERWASYLKIDLEWHIEKKMKYNENRPCRHGKNY